MGGNSRLFFIVLSVGAALGIGNIFLYPYFEFDLSIIFFIPYITALLLIGVPLLMLEFSTGQYFNKNVIDLFASIKKWFSSIGWLMAINSFILMCIYAAVFAWHIVYLFVSFGLQWKESPRTYFFSNVVQISDGFRGFTQLSLPVFIGLGMAWIILFFCIRNGYESVKKSFLVALSALSALTMLFFFYSLTLENALAGIYSFLKFDFADLFRVELWFAAFSLALLSLGVSFGVMNVFARKSEKGFIAGNSFVVITLETMASIAFGFILFAMFGFLAKKEFASTMTFNNYGDLLVALTQVLPFFYKPTLLSILFFSFLSIVFLLGASALGYSIVHILVHKFSSRHLHASILVSGLGFLFGLLFAIRPGFYIMDIITHFIFYNIMLALLLEAIAVGWFFDSEKISAFIDQYSAAKPGKVWRFMIRYAVPLVLMGLIALQLKSDLLVRYNNYPWWALLVFGVAVIAVPLVIAFLMPQKILDRR